MNNGTIRLGGAVTLWRAASFFDAGKIAAEFEALNLDAYAPAKSTNDGNLRFALSKIFDASGQMIRPTQDGFAVVEEVRGQQTQKNRYEQKYAFWLEGDEHNMLRVDPYDFDVGQKVADKFKEFCGLITGDSVTKALVEICKKLKGECIKPSGGVYWIADYNLDEWIQVAQAVERCPVHGQCAIYLIRHAMDEDSIRCIRDGLIDEVEGETSRIEKEVAEDELGKRALDHRVQSAQILLDKVNLYEGLLGAGLEKLKDHCVRVSSAASMAALRAAAAVYSEAS